MSFKTEYDRRKTFIDQIVQRRMDSLVCPSPVLLSSIKYSAATGGKRLRAILALEFFKELKQKASQKEFGQIADIEAFWGLEHMLVAIEILHLYTLIHDDMPCMDNDDFRRGKPSNHKVFGESMALLSGDALLNLAYETLFLGAKSALDKAAYIDACAAFSAYAGLGGVIGGQALEFEADRAKTEQGILTIYEHKTCDLICAAALSGAILAGASESQRQIVKEFGYHFGIAFQVRDDFLDITEKGEVEKNSLLGLTNEQNANNILEQSTKKSLDCLDRLKIKQGFLHELTAFAAKRTT